MLVHVTALNMSSERKREFNAADDPRVSFV